MGYPACLYAVLPAELHSLWAWTGHCAMARRPSTNTDAPFEKMKCFDGTCPMEML